MGNKPSLGASGVSRHIALPNLRRATGSRHATARAARPLRLASPSISQAARSAARVLIGSTSRASCNSFLPGPSLIGQNRLFSQGLATLPDGLEAKRACGAEDRVGAATLWFRGSWLPRPQEDGLGPSGRCLWC